MQSAQSNRLEQLLCADATVRGGAECAPRLDGIDPFARQSIHVLAGALESLAERVSLADPLCEKAVG